MHTLSHSSFAIRIAPWLGALRHNLIDSIRRRRARVEARLAAQAFERLDDRTLRDLGYCRGDAGTMAPELDRLRDHTLLRAMHMI